MTGVAASATSTVAAGMSAVAREVRTHAEHLSSEELLLLRKHPLIKERRYKEDG